VTRELRLGFVVFAFGQTLCERNARQHGQGNFVEILWGQKDSSSKKRTGHILHHGFPILSERTQRRFDHRRPLDSTNLFHEVVKFPTSIEHLRPAKVQYLGAQCASISLPWLVIATHCASMLHYEGMCSVTSAVISTRNFEAA
jgi:hypothetical protein